jgi:hypothetical protein
MQVETGSESKVKVTMTVDVITQTATEAQDNTAHSSAKLSQQLAIITEDSKKNRELAESLSKQLVKYQANVKAAFEGVLQTNTRENTKPKTKGDVVIQKLREKYIVEQVVSIPHILTSSHVIQRIIPLVGCSSESALSFIGAKKEVDHEYEVQKKRNANFETVKATLEAALRENAKLTVILANLKLVEANLRQEIKKKEPLFKIGVAVRIGFLESVKRTWYGGDMVVIRGDPDADIIIAKNNAVHRGNFMANQSLFDLGILKSKQHRDGLRICLQHYRRSSTILLNQAAATELTRYDDYLLLQDQLHS